MNTQRKRPQNASLEKLVDSKLISPEGKSWFICATDPFHDTPVELAGYPDMELSPSVVQCVKQSITIACPGSITTGTWDVNIVAWPLVDQVGGTPATIKDGGIITITTPAIANYQLGGITALACQTGNTTYGNSNAAQITDLSNLSLDFNGVAGYGLGISRVIGMGFEVVNTTSPLNKQGLVTVYKQPQPGIEEAMFLPYGSTAVNWVQSGGADVLLASEPPGTTAAALLLAGSKQWEAAEGCYCVCTLNDINNPPIQPPIFDYAACNNEIQALSQTDTPCVLTNQKTFTLGTGTVSHPIPRFWAPFDMTGAYFTGLSLSTSLVINWNAYVEVFPTPFNKPLVVLAKPSPGLDSEALNLYCCAMRDMPAGVKLSMNPLGEWFQSVVGKVAGTVAPFLSAAAGIHPGFGIAGGLASIIATSANETKKATVVNPSANQLSQVQQVPLYQSTFRSRNPSSVRSANIQRPFPQRGSVPRRAARGNGVRPLIRKKKKTGKRGTRTLGAQGGQFVNFGSNRVFVPNST